MEELCKPLRVLLVENAEEDARLIERTLKQGGFDVSVQRVETAEEMRAALKRQSWDLILSDTNLSHFSGIEALAIAREFDIDNPFILVSGAGGEEYAIEAMRGGAQDYVMKGQLARLVPAIERELRDSAVRRQRREGQTALISQEELYREAIEVAGAVPYYQNYITHRYDFVGPGIEPLIGYAPEEFTYEVWGSLEKEALYIGDIAGLTAEEAVSKARSSDSVKWQAEYRIKTRTGETKWIYNTAIQIRGADGTLVGSFGILQDITARKRAEREADEAYRFVQSTLDALTAHICILNENGTILSVNQAWRDFARDNAADRGAKGLAEGANYLAVCDSCVGDDAEQAAEVASAIRAILKGNSKEFSCEYPCHSPNQKRWFNVHITRFIAEGASLVVVSHSDITQRVLVEKSLGASEDRLRRAITHSPLPIMIHAEDGEVLMISDTWTKISGYTHAEIPTTRAWTKRVYGEKNHRVQAEIDVLYGLTAKIHEGEYEIITKSGEKRIWEFASAPLERLPDGRRLAMSVATDVTDRNKRDARLFQLGAALEAAANAIVISDIRGNIEYVNKAFTTLTGYEADEAIGRNPRTLVKSGVHDDSFFKKMWETILAGKVWSGEITNRRKDGSLYPEDLTITPVKNDEGQIVQFVAIKQDLTEKHLLQNKFLQAQKLEAVGRLAGGIAHDFNNMLNVILGYSQVCFEQLEPEHPVREHIRTIQSAAERSADLTRQLLAFARKQTVSPVVLDLNDAVEGMLKILTRLIGEDITLSWNPGLDLWKVRMDPAQVDQLLANLAVNSRDAIESVGTLAIETKNIILDSDYCEWHPSLAPGRYVLLAVSDDGCGMDKETKENMFEPFFTTKEPEQGTGLGLATVYGIVKQNDGSIHVYSEIGHGTTFKIYLPIHECQDATTTEDPDIINIPTGTETVLLVEDEALLLALATRMLEHLGYRVLPASSPAEAIQLARDHEGTIHLLLTDVVMPKMNGLEFSKVVTADRPDIKTLFVSGYTADSIGNHGVLEEGMVFLAKPFSRDELANKIREALES